MVKKPRVTPQDLEKAYREILEVEVKPTPLDEMDLRQPEMGLVVRTVTTYGAYEEPM